MNWSAYSRFVGDIFGAPLAVEGLLAFFLESTFLGLWIFGWERLSPWLHNACIWMVHVGTLLSAYFILAANSWMQHPVGYTYNPADRPRGAASTSSRCCFNKVQLVTFPHVVLAAYMTGSGLRRRGVASGAWSVTRSMGRTTRRSGTGCGPAPRSCSSPVSASAFTGDVSGKIMTEVQPMKMAAAEALYDTQSHAPFSVFTVGNLDGSEHTDDHRDPRAAVVPRHRPLQRRDPGHRPAPGGVQADVRPGPRRALLLAGRLHPDHRRHLLDLPADDRPGPALRRGRAPDPLRDPARPCPDQPVVGAARHPAAPAPASRPTPSAGSSPRWVASPGWCSA